ncbi:hypothetical protein EOD39_1860 [Acipenser ruthenus]|uniref:Uncharacterized protein n=1 Tax=Acipenser ruthenus TaxID=7906 RepID=A0A444U6V2_ACIRT|nr:hypothetical protein EOD39_1860 [Acipenser ruthenus]
MEVIEMLCGRTLEEKTQQLTVVPQGDAHMVLLNLAEEEGRLERYDRCSPAQVRQRGGQRAAASAIQAESEFHRGKSCKAGVRPGAGSVARLRRFTSMRARGTSVLPVCGSSRPWGDAQTHAAVQAALPARCPPSSAGVGGQL